jgi:hypothetical protein
VGWGSRMGPVPTTLRCPSCDAEYYTAAGNVNVEAERCEVCGSGLEVTGAPSPELAQAAAGATAGDGGHGSGLARFKLPRPRSSASPPRRRRG